jgi:4-hydroxy-tetrahydrodipicolinate synthase
MTETSLRGILAAAVTPVEVGGAISIERCARHLRWLLRGGCHGVALFGTTGEAQAFSVAERQATLDALVEVGIPPAKLMVGIGMCARADTVALGRHALSLGVTRLLCLPPFFYKSNPDAGLVQAFAEAIDGIADGRARILLYHFPQVSGVPITHAVVRSLRQRFGPLLAGIKDSSADRAHTLDLIASFPELAVFAGADQHLLEVLDAGGAGTISAAANLNCVASRAVFDAFERGDRKAAQAGMAAVAGVRGALQGYPLIPAIKAVIAAGHHDPVWAEVRPPLLALPAIERDRLLGQLAELDYDYDPDLHSVAAG